MQRGGRTSQEDQRGSGVKRRGGRHHGQLLSDRALFSCPISQRQPHVVSLDGVRHYGRLVNNNEIDRFSLAIDAIDRTPKLQRIGPHAKERFRNLQIDCRNYAYERGTDSPEINGWKWPL